MIVPGTAARSGAPADAPPGSPAKLKVVWPSRSDPRLKLSVVITALQVLGQTVLGFKVSIAQILVTVGLCAAVEAVVTFRRQHLLIWPASGILTGNSVAFIFRASGTRHGDWFSLHGIGYFVLAALLSLGSKYLIRPGGRHLFNPSNIGLVGALLLVGPAHVFPQYLWWGPLRAPVIAALAVILVGGLWVLRPVRMIPMALAFLATFWALTGIFAATGASFFAIWHTGPVSGAAYWADIALSPEVLVFVFFMMSDPQTAPKDPGGRVLYGAATAVVAAGLLAAQPTEFGIKLAILAALVVTCGLVPLMRWAGQRPAAATPATPAGNRVWWRPLWAGLHRPVVVAALVIAVAAPLDTAALISNTQVVQIERGLTTAHNPQ